MKKIGMIAVIALLMIVPIFGVVQSFVEPIEAVGNVLQSVGDFFTGENEITRLIDSQIKNNGEKTYELLKRVGEKTNGTGIKNNEIVIPLWLSGVVIPNDDLLDEMVDKRLYAETKELLPVYDYVDSLRSIETFKSMFSVLSTSTIVEYIDYYEHRLDRSSIDVSGIKGWVLPLREQIVLGDGVGWYAPFGTLVEHNGQDMIYTHKSICEEPIYASQEGTVVSAGNIWGNSYDGGRGYHLEVQTPEGLIVRYFHFAYPTPYSVGDHVEKGSMIGNVGSTGLSTGCHLHLEVRDQNWNVLDPLDLLPFN